MKTEEGWGFRNLGIGEQKNPYKRIRIGEKCIKLHRWIVENHLGRCLLKNETVHHINGNKHDNRLENLQVMDRGEHMRLHVKNRLRIKKT